MPCFRSHSGFEKVKFIFLYFLYFLDFLGRIKWTQSSFLWNQYLILDIIQLFLENFITSLSLPDYVTRNLCKHDIFQSGYLMSFVLAQHSHDISKSPVNLKYPNVEGEGKKEKGLVSRLDIFINIYKKLILMTCINIMRYNFSYSITCLLLYRLHLHKCIKHYDVILCI